MASERQPNGASVDLPVPTVPNGYQIGDLLIAFVYLGFSDGFDASGIVQTPVGWLALGQDSVAHPSLPSGNAGDRVAVFYRLSTGTEPADYTFTWTGEAGFAGRIVVYRNVDQADPIRVPSPPIVVSSGTGSEPISLDLPFDALGPGRLVCAWMALAEDINFSMPTTMTRRSQTQASSVFLIIPDAGVTSENSILVTLSVCDESLAAAEAGTRTASITTTSQQSDGDRFVFGIAIVVNPAT